MQKYSPPSHYASVTQQLINVYFLNPYFAAEIYYKKKMLKYKRLLDFIICQYVLHQKIGSTFIAFFPLITIPTAKSGLYKTEKH
jgi:hypothetical protein